MITGTWAETVDIFSCASLLLKATHMYLLNKTEKGFNFKPMMNTDSFSSIATKKQCRCRILCFSEYLRSLSRHNPTQHNATGHISNIICITERRNNLKAACTDVNTTEKGLLSYYISIYT